MKKKAKMLEKMLDNYCLYKSHAQEYKRMARDDKDYGLSKEELEKISNEYWLQAFTVEGIIKECFGESVDVYGYYLEHMDEYM